MFSYGVLLWELVTKEVPRRGHLRPVRVPEECAPHLFLLRCCMPRIMCVGASPDALLEARSGLEPCLDRDFKPPQCQ